MTKAISSYPEHEKFQVAKRRVERKSGGLGYWAAKDAQTHFGKPKIVEVKTVEEPSHEESSQD